MRRRGRRWGRGGLPVGGQLPADWRAKAYYRAPVKLLSPSVPLPEEIRENSAPLVRPLKPVRQRWRSDAIASKRMFLQKSLRQ